VIVRVREGVGARIALGFLTLVFKVWSEEIGADGTLCLLDPTETSALWELRRRTRSLQNTNKTPDAEVSRRSSSN